MTQARTHGTQTHTYTSAVSASWSESGNTVTVTNHSNAIVGVDFSYDSIAAFSTVTGNFDVGSYTLSAGSTNGYATADSVTTELTLAGTIASTQTTFTKVGTITVALS